MSDPAIIVEDLVKLYKSRTDHPVRALDGLSISVGNGEIFGLLGRNGAGKTTLLRILTTLIRPTSGRVSVLGLDVSERQLEIRRNICVVLQETAVELYLSVRDNLDTYARFQGVPRVLIPERIKKVTEQFGLGDVLQQKTIDLSGGLKRRVQVAKVFMVDKPVIFLDEATMGMDAINKRATLNAIHEETLKGRTIVLTTHILEEAEELCDKVAIIDRGKIVASGDLPTIKSIVSGTIDIILTFETLTDEVLRQLKTLPLQKFSQAGNTVELCLRVDHLTVLDYVAQLARSAKVLNVEVATTSLEDAFIEIIDRIRPSETGAPESLSHDER